MQQYYTSIENNDGRYTAIVHNSSNNAEEYRSKSYHSQIQAMMDVTEYLKTKQSPNQPKQQIITNTAVYRPAPQAPRRCCGR